MMSLVGRRTGIVRRLDVLPLEAGDAPLWIAGAETGDTTPLGGNARPAVGGAVAWKRRDSVNAAIAEACERYCASFTPTQVRAPARDLPGAVLEWTSFTPTQRDHDKHIFAHLTPTLQLDWTAAQDLAGGTAWVPSQMAAMAGWGEGDALLGPTTSTGLAAGADRESALLAGLYETVERDAFTLMWLAGARPARVAHEDLPARVRDLAEFGRFHVFDLTHDIGLPVMMCMLEKDSVIGKVICVGAACRHDSAAAAEKAVLEAFQTFPYVRDIVRKEPGWRVEPDFTNLRDFRDHCRLYTVHPELRAGVAAFLDEAREEVPLRPPAAIEADNALDDAVRRVSRVGLRVLAVDLTTPDVAAHGLTVVRILVPGMQPLHGHHQAAHLDSDRLRRVHEVLPYADRPFTEAQVNPWPHPFA